MGKFWWKKFFTDKENHRACARLGFGRASSLVVSHVVHFIGGMDWGAKGVNMKR
jgi:hypothetical protein